MILRTNAEDVFERELSYTKAKIMQVPHNESAWNYLRGLCTSLGLPSKMAADGSLHDLCLEVCQKPLLLLLLLLAIGFQILFFRSCADICINLKELGRCYSLGYMIASPCRCCSPGRLATSPWPFWRTSMRRRAWCYKLSQSSKLLQMQPSVQSSALQCLILLIPSAEDTGGSDGWIYRSFVCPR